MRHDIDNMKVFLNIVEKETFTAAAEELNCSTSSISKRITQLEHDVGVKLINRSTHGVLSLTEAGTVYLAGVRKVLHEIECARDSVDEIIKTVRGDLKIHITPGTAHKIALPALFEFIRQYRSLSVNFSTRADIVETDLLRHGYDVLIRSSAIREGNISLGGFETKELARARYIICASPAYFAENGKPTHPRDLAQHNCLISARQPSANQWWFRINHKSFGVNVSGNLVTDDWVAIYEAARAGLGIARIFQPACKSVAFEGLETIFEDMMVLDRVVWAIVPRMSPRPKKIDVFLDFLSSYLASA